MGERKLTLLSKPLGGVATGGGGGGSSSITSILNVTLRFVFNSMGCFNNHCYVQDVLPWQVPFSLANPGTHIHSNEPSLFEHCVFWSSTHKSTALVAASKHSSMSV